MYSVVHIYIYDSITFDVIVVGIVVFIDVNNIYIYGVVSNAILKLTREFN